VRSGKCPPITRSTTVEQYLLSVHSVEGEVGDPNVAEKPHRGLSLAVPAGNRTPQVRRTTRTPVVRRDVLGGLIHENRWAA
jgi:hypothetical protein